MLSDLGKAGNPVIPFLFAGVVPSGERHGFRRALDRIQGTILLALWFTLRESGMATLTTPSRADWTVADLLERFGPIPFRRIRQVPGPGAATEQDVVEIRGRER